MYIKMCIYGLSVLREAMRFCFNKHRVSEFTRLFFFLSHSFNDLKFRECQILSGSLGNNPFFVFSSF